MFYHTPVLVDVVSRYLPVRADGIYVDGTLGGGGHAESILKNLSSHGKLIGFDLDIDAITFSQNRLRKFGNKMLFVQGNFSNIKQHLDELGITGIDGLILDLGLSSRQIDDIKRGFSFKENNRIDMRMNQKQQLDGWKVINQYDQTKLAEIFWKYGEEKNSHRIARKIVSVRNSNPINTTSELASLVASSVGQQFLNKSLARVFQAIRIEVNGELDHLKKGLSDSLDLMLIGGKIAVISYHSLEDRIVKDFFKSESQTSIASGHKLIADKQITPRLKIVNKKPIVPTKVETEINPRARSAKLRVAERI